MLGLCEAWSANGQRQDIHSHLRVKVRFPKSHTVVSEVSAPDIAFSALLTVINSNPLKS